MPSVMMMLSCQTVVLHASDAVLGRADTRLGCRLRLNAPLYQEVDSHSVERCQVGGRRQFPIVFLHWLAASVLRHLARDDELEAAVVALAKTGTHVEPYAGLILMFCTAVARAVGACAACNGDVVVLVGLRVLDVQLVVGHNVIARRCLLPFLDGFKILVLHNLVYVDVPVPLASHRRSSS